MTTKDATVIIGIPTITYRMHNLGDDKMITLALRADECAFCEAAARYCGFTDVGDTAFICLGVGETHVQQVEVVALDAQDRLVLQCHTVTAEAARRFIQRYAKN